MAHGLEILGSRVLCERFEKLGIGGPGLGVLANLETLCLKLHFSTLGRLTR